MGLKESRHNRTPERNKRFNVEVQRAGIEEKPVLRNLMELYRYDSSEFDGADVGEHGLFTYRYLDHYWTEPGRHAFIVRVDGRLAGFVMVRILETDGAEAVHSIAEFFIMRRYRRQNVGTTVARRIFDMFPGRWRVAEEEANAPAQAFWRKVTRRYTEGKFREQRVDEWDGPVQEFRN